MTKEGNLEIQNERRKEMVNTYVNITDHFSPLKFFKIHITIESKKYSIIW